MQINCCTKIAGQIVSCDKRETFSGVMVTQRCLTFSGNSEVEVCYGDSDVF